jgi:hypothetical protein
MNKQVLFKSLLLIGFLIASTSVSEAKPSGETRVSSNLSSGPRVEQLKSGGTQLGVKLDSRPLEHGKQLNRAGTQLGDH